VPVDELMTVPAVALFVDRAQAVRPDFALTQSNAAAVAEICRRLEGLPLAIELAAARTRLLDPGALLTRLTASLDVLSISAADLPGRQQTLRATVEWSVNLLDDAERSLLEVAAVFEDGWTIEAAAQVAGLQEDTALELSEALARHSLIYMDSGPRSRSRMLDTIRAFVTERLEARPDAAQIRRRHAGYFRALAEQADPALRGPGHGQWLERLDAEAGNLAASLRWYLGHDRGPLPHMFRVLWPFWFIRDHITQARAWIDELLPMAGSLGPQARAELLWTAAATALEVGDDTAALAARQDLAPLLDRIQDPFLHAVSQLVTAWTSPITGDFDDASRAASAALEELRSQGEPVWTALAAGSLGWLEMSAGRSDDALRHLREVRDLADRFDSDWLAAWSRAQLGTLAVVQGRLDRARELLGDALARSLEAHSTVSVTLCMIAFARLAFAEGDPDRAALLAGAAEGLRRRLGLRAWPMLGQGETELISQIRQAAGPDRFSKMTQAGSRLSRQEAVDAIWHQRGTDAGNPAAGTKCPVTAAGSGAGTAAAGAAGLCGLGVVVAGRVSAGGFPVVGDGGHQLVGAAEPVEGRAQAGEVVHERFEEPARADADDDFGFGVADGAQRGRGDLLRAYGEGGAGGQAGLGAGAGADPGVLDGAENDAGGRYPGVPVVAVQHPAEGGEPVLGRGVGLGVREAGMPGQRGDVDDPAISPFEHAGQQEPGEQQRADQVDLQHVPDFGRGEHVEAGLRLGGRVVDQHVDGP
jgi:predicted ATPase